jgi:hypothetical protein
MFFSVSDFMKGTLASVICKFVVFSGLSFGVSFVSLFGIHFFKMDSITMLL